MATWRSQAETKNVYLLMPQCMATIQHLHMTPSLPLPVPVAATSGLDVGGGAGRGGAHTQQVVL